MTQPCQQGAVQPSSSASRSGALSSSLSWCSLWWCTTTRSQLCRACVLFSAPVFRAGPHVMSHQGSAGIGGTSIGRISPRCLSRALFSVEGRADVCLFLLYHVV